MKDRYSNSTNQITVVTSRIQFIYTQFIAHHDLFSWLSVASAGCNEQPPQQSYLTLAYDIDVNGIAAYIQLG